MIFESISAAGSLFSIANIIKEWFHSDNSDIPPLRFEYTYQGPHMLLRITNVSGRTVKKIRIKRDFSDTVKPYFDNEKTDRFGGVPFDLCPGESRKDVVGLFPLSMDYPEPYPMITINVSYRYDGREEEFRREVYLTK